MTKADLKNKQRVWVNDGIILVMLCRVNILPSGYTTLTDPNGFVYALPFLESKFSELNFEIYEPF